MKPYDCPLTGQLMWMLTVRGPHTDLQHERPGNHPTKCYTAFWQLPPSSSVYLSLWSRTQWVFRLGQIYSTSKHHWAQPGQLIRKRLVRYEARRECFQHLPIEWITKSHGRQIGEVDAHMYTCTYGTIEDKSFIVQFVQMQTQTSCSQGYKNCGPVLTLLDDMSEEMREENAEHLATSLARMLPFENNTLTLCIPNICMHMLHLKDIKYIQ